MSDYIFKFLPYTVGKKGFRRFHKKLEFKIRESALTRVMTNIGYAMMWDIMADIMSFKKPVPCSEIDIPIMKSDIEIWFKDRKVK
jgi:hypothetical protein